MIKILSFLTLFPIAFSGVLTAQISSQKEYHYLIEPLGTNINSEFNDYSPVVSSDGMNLFFTSRRPLANKEITQNTEGTERVYVSVFDKETNSWGDAQSLDNNINKKGRHNSVLSISNDGQLLLIYQDNKNGNGDIYECYLEKDNWSVPEPLDESINSNFHESSASLSSDGKTLYFVSSRMGGVGGRDIWKSEKDENGKWGKATNLGRTINTPKNEETVFIHPNGKTMYFSSTGHKSTGGYDIYKSTLLKGKWTKPQNLGSQINSKEDELFYSEDVTGKTAYFVSDKSGKNRDIYKVSISQTPTANEQKQQRLALVKGTIEDTNHEPVQATIEVKDIEKGELVASFSSDEETGHFFMSLPIGKNYGISVLASDYLSYTENFILSDAEDFDQIIKHISLNSSIIGAKAILRNIFFDYGKADLRSESMNEINRLAKILRENPLVKAEISGHSDNSSSSAFNLQLSEMRAKAVVDALIAKGISPDRLIYKGYGESQPIADNFTELSREENRRVEFRIVAN